MRHRSDAFLLGAIMGDKIDTKTVMNTTESSICAYCGKEYLRNKRGRIPRFCSIKCKDKHNYYLKHPGKEYVVTCVNCGKLFNSNNNNVKYCSDVCKEIFYKKTRTIYDKVCTWCGKDYTSRDKTQQCCSPECGHQQGSEKLKKYYICQFCGKSFSKGNAYRMKYCSQACSITANYGTLEERNLRKKQEREFRIAIHTIKKVCLICEKQFETIYPRHLYCSSECGYEANLRAHRLQWANEYVPQSFRCRKCGIQVTTVCGNTHSQFCSIDCQKKYHSIIYKQCRREQMKQAHRSNVSFKMIYKRDDGICQICGLPVVFDKSPEKTWAATIDHINPIALGGTHEPSNCQLAHRLCNSIKSTLSDSYIIDWDTKNASEDGRWSDQLLEYDMLMADYLHDSP